MLPPMITARLSLRCRCGKLRGALSGVSPNTVNRVVCYCKDCQAFARFLGRADVLDAHGGSDIVHVAPAKIAISSGPDELRCLRLSSEGLFRWYAGCCDTPIGNMVGARFPFIGLLATFIGDAEDGRVREVVLGPPFARIHGREAIGGVPAGAHARVDARMMLRVFRLVFGWWVRGMAQPSPFFDGPTRAPKSAPRVLSADERAAATSAVQA